MFTQRAILLGIVAFCFYLIAVVNSLPTFYFALTWLAVVMLGASLAIALLSLVGVEFSYAVVRSRASASLEAAEGDGPQVRMLISNRGTLNKTGILVVLGLRDAQNRRRVQRFVIEAVPSGAAIESVLPLSDLGRGCYCLEEATLTGSDVLGLFRVRKRFLPLETSVRDIIVGPPMLRGAVETSVGGGARSGSRRTVQTGTGEELRGTRPYAPGDDLRHVHWKSSARAGELVVKEFEQTGRGAVLVVWDGAANTTANITANTTAGAGDWNSDEASLILCASLCHATLSSGTPCDFARLDEAPVLVGARGLSGDQLPIALIDALAGAGANRKTGLEAALHAVPSLAARSYASVLLVTASPSDEVLSHARFWRNRGARVQILLIDGTRLTSRHERRPRAASHKTEANPAVPSASLAAQLVRLRESGFEVVSVILDAEKSAEALRAALRELPLSRPANRPFAAQAKANPDAEPVARH
ncbi:MAG TPA: DUF58 domain-containing protein [Abditibacterium sp.]|jgi:uncharacterized protein (DUF58 family)